METKNDNFLPTQESKGEGECIPTQPAVEQESETNERRQAVEAADRIGVNLATMNECVAAGAAIPDPANLYDGLWYEGELTALYADTNLGKSILAIQIAEEVAKKGFTTLYVDLELSDKGVEKRARRKDGGLHVFPENLHRATVNFSKILSSGENIDQNGLDIIDRIEAVALRMGAKAVIIDNITALCAGMESGDVAVRLVNRLIQLRNDTGMSILFIAHTPKLDRTQPITRDSMGGSKRVISLIDSAFAIGQCVFDPAVRYIKQTKVRLDEVKYHDNNVLACKIDRVDGLLKFVAIRTCAEMELLDNKQEKERLSSKIIEKYDHGCTIINIAKELNIPRHKVVYVLDKYRPNRNVVKPQGDTLDL